MKSIDVQPLKSLVVKDFFNIYSMPQEQLHQTKFHTTKLSTFASLAIVSYILGTLFGVAIHMNNINLSLVFSNISYVLAILFVIKSSIHVYHYSKHSDISFNINQSFKKSRFSTLLAAGFLILPTICKIIF